MELDTLLQLEQEMSKQKTFYSLHPSLASCAHQMKRMETLVNYLLASRTAEHPPLGDLPPTTTTPTLNAHTSSDSSNSGSYRGVHPPRPQPRPLSSSSPRQRDPNHLESTKNIYYSQLLVRPKQQQHPSSARSLANRGTASSTSHTSSHRPHPPGKPPVAQRSQSARPLTSGPSGSFGGDRADGGSGGGASPRVTPLIRSYCDVKHNRHPPVPGSSTPLQAKHAPRGNWFPSPDQPPSGRDLRSTTDTLSRGGSAGMHRASPRGIQDPNTSQEEGGEQEVIHLVRREERRTFTTRQSNQFTGLPPSSPTVSESGGVKVCSASGGGGGGAAAAARFFPRPYSAAASSTHPAAVAAVAATAAATVICAPPPRALLLAYNSSGGGGDLQGGSGGRSTLHAAQRGVHDNLLGVRSLEASSGRGV